MDVFRTEWRPETRQALLRYGDFVFTSGSCFADRFGGWLRDNKFSVSVNPFGISYNPLSIHQQVQWSVCAQHPADNHVVQREGTFVHLDFHSAFRSNREADLQKQLNEALQQAGKDLAQASWLMLTYGTAWVYQYNPTQLLINNCHKIPAHFFHRRLLTVSEITASFAQLYSLIRAANPSLKILLTLSPVRHVKDTFEGNAISKAILRLAIHQIQAAHPDVTYFPAYEIMLDDLRDYRFYEADLIHPNAQAEAYLWQKFAAAFFANETGRLMDAWQKIQRALRHRPFEENSPAHVDFLMRVSEQLESIRAFLPVENEMAEVKHQLSRLKNR